MSGGENTADVRSTRLEGGGGGVLGLSVLEESGELKDVLAGGRDSLAELLRDTEGPSVFFIWLCRRVKGGVGGLLNCAAGLGEDSERDGTLLPGTGGGILPVGMLGKGLWLFVLG